MIETKTKNNFLEENKNKRRLNLKIFNKILFIFVIAFGVFYILGVNDLATKGFKINALKKNLNNLNNENIKLESQVTSLSAYNNLSKKLEDIGMVKIGRVDYISAGSGAVAKK